jgi:multicomponent Na+:H+ antiporter subunit F
MGEEDNRMTLLATGLMLLASALGILIVVCLIRTALGPTLPDRVVALDTINTLAVATLVTLGAAFEEITYIDVAIVYSMLAFVSTLYISNYLEGHT